MVIKCRLRDNNVIVKCVLANRGDVLIKVVTFFVRCYKYGVGRREIIPKSKMANYFNNGDYYDVEMLYAAPL